MTNNDPYRRLEELLDTFVAVARTDPYYADEVQLKASGRGSDGRFETFFSRRGPRWEAYQDLVLEVSDRFGQAESFLDNEPEDLHAALTLAETVIETLGPDWGVTVRPIRRKRQIKPSHQQPA